MVATFIGIITPYLQANRVGVVTPYWAALISASIVSLILHGLPNNLGLLCAALVGVMVGYLVTKRRAPNKPINETEAVLKEGL